VAKEFDSAMVEPDFVLTCLDLMTVELISARGGAPPKATKDMALGVAPNPSLPPFNFPWPNC
jgi:hypothetical protein